MKYSIFGVQRASGWCQPLPPGGGIALRLPSAASYFYLFPYSKSEITDPINTSIFHMTAMAVTVGTQIRESIHTLFFVRDLGVLVANHIFVLYLILSFFLWVLAYGTVCFQFHLEQWLQ